MQAPPPLVRSAAASAAEVSGPAPGADIGHSGPRSGSSQHTPAVAARGRGAWPHGALQPAFEERRVIRREETAAVISTALALRQRLRAEVTIDGSLANSPRLGDGPP